ncbi:MAG: S-layer homology domain-containing protein, partial [Clostridia bacterium]|nr:S-layer homology domain-containing protein [Clostridia bacterium]
DVSSRAELDRFPDGAKTHSYAKDAVSWAVAEGLISGTKAGDRVLLDPRGSATRAQVATILMRYLGE